MFDFSGKTVLVTGAASGIGLASMECFFKSGAYVLAADIDIGALTTLTAQLDKSGEWIHPVSYDAANSDSADEIIATSVDRFGSLDHLILCAGIYNRRPLLEMSDEEWEKTLSVNLDGTFYIIRAAAKVLNDGGSIVTLASVAANKGAFNGYAHYGASKGGVLALTRSVATELAPRIRVNCVSPGLIKTPMTSDLIDRMGEDIRKQILVGRYGEPKEIASVIAFLCSNAASFVNGEAIIVSGGAYMG